MTAGVTDMQRFDGSAHSARLSYTGLSDPDAAVLIDTLHRDVIVPNVDRIIDRFYEALAKSREFNALVRTDAERQRIRDTQRRYLLELGRNVNTRKYFEDRVRIGVVHYRVGVSLSLYQCFFSLLQVLIIESIPKGIRSDPAAYEAMVTLIVRLMSLDMSLATETYHSTSVSGLERSIDHFRHEGEVLRQTLRLDSLTGVFTRGFSIEMLTSAIREAQQLERPLCVVMADIDRFKKINDRFGHVFGDHVLRIVGARIGSQARSIDAVGRYGGDEFIIVLRDTDLVEGTRVAERICHQVAEAPIHKNEYQVPVTLSLGVAAVRSGDVLESLTERADQCLYQAKHAGRNSVRSELDLPNPG